MQGKDLLSILDLSSHDILDIVHRGYLIAREPVLPLLVGKNVALLFEKPSLRTRASFHVAIQQLGGYSFYMGPDEVGLGAREAVADVGRVLSRYVDCIVARVVLPLHSGGARETRLGACDQRTFRLGAPLSGPCRPPDHPRA